ncbi:MAG: Tn3 family transposase, partial [Blastocatellia bacterium]
MTDADVVTFFTLTSTERALVTKLHNDANRMGFALQLCSLRYLGFVPDELHNAPPVVIEFLAPQLSVSPKSIEAYGERPQTRTDHLQEIEAYLGYRKMDASVKDDLDRWLVDRALEHDRPSLLLGLVCERLQAFKIIRPRVTVLERIVIKARQQARAITWELVSHLVTDDTKAILDGLLKTDESTRRSELVWLRTSAVSSSAAAILQVIDKLGHLRRAGVDQWNLSSLNPNRIKRLAQIGRTATSQTLERLLPERRYPVLFALLHQTLTETIDEAIDLYDRNLSDAYARAGRELDEFRRGIARSTNEKVRLFQTVGRILLYPAIPDSAIRSYVYKEIEPQYLREAVDECDDIIRPPDDSYLDLLGTRYRTLRQFAPQFLDAFTWRSNSGDGLIEAIDLLRSLNSSGSRKVPPNAPARFIPAKWKPYVIDEDGEYSRRYWEVCLLWQMREALRAGNLWVEGSRRHANPASYLIPPSRWLELRPEAARLMKIPEDGALRLKQRSEEVKSAAEALSHQLAGRGKVRIEDGELVVGHLDAEDRSASCEALEEAISDRLPRIDLPALLIEVDQWVNYTRTFSHAGDNRHVRAEVLPSIYASLLAQSGNFGLIQMSRMSDFQYQQLVWTTNWYIREETLRNATTKLVNYHYSLPL